MGNSTILLVARVLLAAIFVWSGLGKFGNIGGLAGYIGSAGLPAPMLLAWLAAIFEVVGGIALLAGFQTRNVAFAMAAFCVFTGLVFHFDTGDRGQMINLMKNLSMAGGFLALAVTGAGAFSVDAKRG